MNLTSSARAALAACLIIAAATAAAALRDWTQNEISSIKTAAANASGRASSVRDELAGAPDLVDAVEDGLAMLTPDIREAVDFARQEFSRIVADERDGMDEFLGQGGTCLPGSPCAEFRSKVLDLFAGLQMLGNTLLALEPATAAHVVVDLQRATTLFHATSDRLLYPMYRASSIEQNFLRGNVREFFVELARVLGLLATVLSAPVSEQCDLVLGDPAAVERAALVTKSGSLTLLAVGGAMRAAGATGIDGWQAGIHGYVALNLKFNPSKRWGIVITGMSKSLGLVSDHATFVHRYCTLVLNEQLFVDAIREASYPGRGGRP